MPNPFEEDSPVPIDEQSAPVEPAEKPTRNLTQHTLSGLLWMLSGSGVYALLRMLVLVVLSRLLTPEDFGLASTGLLVLGFASLVSQAGMEQAIVQRPQVEERHLRAALAAFSALGALVAVLVALAAPWIADFFHMPGLTPILYVVACVILIQGWVSVPTALLKRNLRFRRLASTNVIAYFVGYVVVGIATAFAGWGAWALVSAMLAQGLATAAMMMMAQPYPKWPRVDRGALHELFYFGGGFTLARLLNYGALQGDNFVAGRWLGAEALGIYSRAYQLLIFPVDLMGNALDQVLFPSMAKVQHDPERLEMAYRRSVAVTALAFLPLSMGAVVLAPELIRVVLGAQWGAVILPFQVLAAGMLFRAGYKMSDSLARATGAVYRRAWRQGIYCLLVVGGAILGQRWGVTGIAAATLIGMLVNFLLMGHLSLKLTTLTWRDFLTAHEPAMLLAFSTLGVVWLTAALLRSLALPAIVVLLVSTLTTGVAMVILAYLLPGRLLGQDGMWIGKTVAAFLATKYNRVSPEVGVARKVSKA